MTKPEFLSKQSDWKRYRSKVGYIYVAGFGIFLLWSLLFSGAGHLNETSVTWQICFFIYLAGGGIFVICLNTRRIKQIGAVCPKCRNLLLFNEFSTRHVIVTGKCRRCGETIFELDRAA